MSSFKEYWDERFKIEGKIWGLNPSKSAHIAIKYYETRTIKTILVPGAGYGRNTKLFSDHNFEVVGHEISPIALKIATNFDKKTKFIQKNVLKISINEPQFDAIYCYNVLHLFLKGDRARFVQNCLNQLKKNGYIFCIVFSDKEKFYGKGKEVELNTFESKPGRPVHYFTEEDLIEHFKQFNIINLGIIEDEEEHGDVGKHLHELRYIIAQKK